MTYTVGVEPDRLPFGAESDPAATRESNRRANCMVAAQVIAGQEFLQIR
jgi:hypothetical protein